VHWLGTLPNKTDGEWEEKTKIKKEGHLGGAKCGGASVNVRDPRTLKKDVGAQRNVNGEAAGKLGGQRIEQ